MVKMFQHSLRHFESVFEHSFKKIFLLLTPFSPGGEGKNSDENDGI